MLETSWNPRIAPESDHAAGKVALIEVEKRKQHGTSLCKNKLHG